jgi:hypothetical protein
MSLWNSVRSLFSGKPAQPRPEGQIELAPGLSFSATRHSINTQWGEHECYSFVTQGLAAHGQRELVLTLRATPGAMSDSFIAELKGYFIAVRDFAAEGRLVNVGAVTMFGQRRPFPGWHLLYTVPYPWPGVPIPPNALAVVFITDKEMELQRRCGSARVMTALGKMYSHYPCPSWCDPQRPELPAAAILEASLLAKTGGIINWDVRVLQNGNDIVLRIPPRQQPHVRQFLEQAPEDAVIPLITGIDRTADACLTWEPGQREPTAISVPGSTGEWVSGCFLMIVPGQEEESARVFEDGFTWMLNDTSWQALRRALMEGQALALLIQDKRLRLEWVDA